MEWLNNIPKWIKYAFIGGGALVSALAGHLPDYLQTWGLTVGFLFIAIGFVGLVYHVVKKELGHLLSFWKFQWPIKKRKGWPQSAQLEARIPHVRTYARYYVALATALISVVLCFPAHGYPFVKACHVTAAENRRVPLAKNIEIEKPSVAINVCGALTDSYRVIIKEIVAAPHFWKREWAIWPNDNFGGFRVHSRRHIPLLFKIDWLLGADLENNHRGFNISGRSPMIYDHKVETRAVPLRVPAGSRIKIKTYVVFDGRPKNEWAFKFDQSGFGNFGRFERGVGGNLRQAGLTTGGNPQGTSEPSDDDGSQRGDSRTVLVSETTGTSDVDTENGWVIFCGSVAAAVLVPLYAALEGWREKSFADDKKRQRQKYKG